jgi:putative membrane protein
VGIAGLLVCSGPSYAQQSGDAQSGNSGMTSGTSTMTSSGDTKFATEAAQGGLAEVQLGQLASEKGTNPAVKAFGERMVQDHTKLNDQMKQVAQKDGMTLPTNLDPKDQALYDRLKNESGAQFDKTYMTAMVKDHEHDIKEFQKEARAGKNPDLKQQASQALPILEQHLSLAKTAEAQVKSGS